MGVPAADYQRPSRAKPEPIEPKAKMGSWWANPNLSWGDFHDLADVAQKHMTRVKNTTLGPLMPHTPSERD